MFVARITLKIDEQKRAAFRAVALAEGLAPRGLDGCVEYTFCEDVQDPGRVLLYEEWTSRAAFEAYRQAPCFGTTNATLRPLLAAPPRSAYYESDDVSGAFGAR